MTEEDFKGSVHAITLSLAAVMCAYNLMKWCSDGGTRYAVNGILYGSLLLPFEGYQTWRHWHTNT